MNIFYEESGQFKVASIVQKNDATYQVDTQHGKRTKVKANNVFAEFDGDMAAFLENAQAQAADIDTDLLWEVCGEEEFTAEAIAEEELTSFVLTADNIGDGQVWGIEFDLSTPLDFVDAPYEETAMKSMGASFGSARARLVLPRPAAPCRRKGWPGASPP